MQYTHIYHETIQLDEIEINVNESSKGPIGLKLL